MTLNARSLKNLQGVHPDLAAVVMRASEKCEFLVTEGLRTLERQQQLKKAGKSKTLNSRHLTGHAVDLCDCDGCYDVPDMKEIAAAMKSAAVELHIPIEWGGDWKSFVDTPHFQLPWKDHPRSGLNAVQKTVEAVKTKTAVGAATGGAAMTLPHLPAPPDLSAWTAWQGAGDTVSNLVSWAGHNVMITAVLVVWVAGLAFLPQLKARLT